MKKTHSTVVITLIAAGALALSGCSGSNSSPGSGAGSADPVVITLAVQTSAGNQSAYNWAIQEFKKVHPDVTVKPQYVGGDYGAVITTQMRGANAPDMIDLAPGRSVPNGVLAMANAGFLQDLSDQSWTKSIASDTKPLVSEGDKVYAWPTVVQVSALFANEKLLSDNGLKVPATIGELVHACGVLKDAGITPIAWTGVPVNRNGGQVTTLASVTGAATQDVAIDIASGKTSFADSPEWKATFDLVQKLSDAGCFGADAVVATDAAVSQAVLSGRAAMLMGNTQSFGQIEAQATADSPKFKGFPMPGEKAADASSLLTPYNALAVSVKASDAQKAAAKEFIAFVADPANQAQFASRIGSIASMDIASGKVPDYLANIAPTIAAGRAFVNPVLLWTPSMYPAMSSGVQGILTRQTTPNQLLTTMDGSR